MLVQPTAAHNMKPAASPTNRDQDKGKLEIITDNCSWSVLALVLLGG